MAEQQRGTLGEVGLDLVRVDGALHLVGRQDDDEVGLGDGLGHAEHPQASASALARDFEPSASPTRTSTPESRRFSVGVALAAVPDDRDLAALDDRQVGVVVVEHLGHRLGLSSWWW